MKKFQKILSITLSIVMVLSILVINPTTSYAAPKVKLSDTKLVLKEDDSARLYLRNAKAKNVKWSSSNKNVATVSKGKIKAVGAGNAAITAKYKNKSYKCKVTVKKFGVKYIDSEVIATIHKDFDYCNIYKYTNNTDCDVKIKIETMIYDKDGYFIQNDIDSITCKKNESAFFPKYIMNDYTCKQKIEISEQQIPSESISYKILNTETKLDDSWNTNTYTVEISNDSSKNIRCNVIALVYDENNNIIDFGYLTGDFIGNSLVPANEKVKKEIPIRYPSNTKISIKIMDYNYSYNYY